jgi:asparagine synthase (glutamine-hydrolysing)
MRMIYATVAANDAAPAGRHDLAETGGQTVARMMAAMGDCPWDSSTRRSLPGPHRCCTLAVQTASEAAVARDASTLLPSFAGLTITADARIDNRTELYAELAVALAERAMLDDAGLILRAYQRWGTACVEHLRGDFAFALWDEAAELLFCARDIVGVRPFYYHHAPAAGRFVCAGALPAMVVHPAVPGTLNLAYLRAYLQTSAFQFRHEDQTFYQEIRKLPPAQCLTLDRSGLHTRTYWRPGQFAERRYASENQYVEELRALLIEAVACRVESPYPVGAHISGGLDSSSLAVLAHRALRTQGREVTGFSWAPAPPADPTGLLPHDERVLVEAVREAEGFPVRYTTLTPRHALVHTTRDIMVRPSATLLSELAASEDAARLGIRTLLSGWGGDELLVFNGRGYFSDLLRRGRWMAMHRELSLRAHLQGGSAWRGWIGSGLLPLLPTPLWRRLRPEEAAGSMPLPASLRPEFAAALAGVEPLPDPVLRERPGVRNVQIALLQHGHLSYRMESWAGHGATLGITYAFPLLDQRLVEFALSIPDDLFFKNGWKRYLFRTAMADILPDRVRWHRLKEDQATAAATRRARKEAAEGVRAALLARADNPFVDVAPLVAEMEEAGQALYAHEAGGDQRAWRHGTRRAASIRRATSLAFAGATTKDRAY